MLVPILLAIIGLIVGLGLGFMVANHVMKKKLMGHKTQLEGSSRMLIKKRKP